MSTVMAGYANLPAKRLTGVMHARIWIGIFTMCVLLQSGCAASFDRILRATSIASEGIVQVEPVRRRRSRIIRNLTARIPLPSERTQLLLRKYNLESRYEVDPDAVIAWFQELAQARPTMEEIHGLAEIAELQADWSASAGESERATRLYSIAVIHAYQFLFDAKLNIARNAYDPQFRSICDVYNRSLEGLLREVFADEELATGKTVVVGQGSQGLEFEIQIDGRWRDQNFERFELVNDFRASGIDNQYHTYGLGVPLIAVRKQQQVASEFEKYYPQEITMPMTAFMHLIKDSSVLDADGRYLDSADDSSLPMQRAILKLYDPLEQTLVETESKVVPLESDITTPLAYGLRDPLINKGVLATASLLNAEYAPETYGLFMLEPFDPGKIPVVMIHGLWSSPATWVHMFNDLRATREIHENCQFWFYSYPTGQPFWISAQQLRKDLAKIRQEVDPRGDSQSMDQMVLVGHSMGGLISIMQTIESGDHFWNVISEHGIDELEGDKSTIDLLRETFYFRPNPSVERVITLATPFKGSEFANPATRWVSQKLFTLPSLVTQGFQEVAKQNKQLLNATSLLTTATSIDSLAPMGSVFEAFAEAEPSSQATTHNIVGKLDRKSILKTTEDKSNPFTGDGVVSLESADNANAKSQAYVDAEHSEIHQHPGSIYEVRRILLEHLVEYNRIRSREIPEMPPVQQASLVVEEAEPVGPAVPSTLRR